MRAAKFLLQLHKSRGVLHHCRSGIVAHMRNHKCFDPPGDQFDDSIHLIYTAVFIVFSLDYQSRAVNFGQK